MNSLKTGRGSQKNIEASRPKRARFVFFYRAQLGSNFDFSPVRIA